MIPTVGRIVDYVLTDKYGEDQIRPAIIVRVWDAEMVQLQVFTDGSNDGAEYASGIYWATSVHRSETKEPRTWDWMPYQKGQAAKTEQLEARIAETGQKDLGITEVRGAKANISDLVVYGNGDTFALLCKASSQSQGWMKSTKVCNTDHGCIVQVTTQQRNQDGSYAVAEALTFVPGMNIDTTADLRCLIPISGI